MKLFLISAFVLLATASGLTIKSNSGRVNNNDGYIVTAPKIFIGEESVCLTLFDRQSFPVDTTFKVELKSLKDSETLFESEQSLTSGEKLYQLNVVEMLL